MSGGYSDERSAVKGDQISVDVFGARFSPRRFCLKFAVKRDQETDVLV